MRHCYTQNGPSSKLLNEMQFPFFWYLSHFVSFCLIFLLTDRQDSARMKGRSVTSDRKFRRVSVIFGSFRASGELKSPIAVQAAYVNAPVHSLPSSSVLPQLHLL